MLISPTLRHHLKLSAAQSPEVGLGNEPVSPLGFAAEENADGNEAASLDVGPKTSRIDFRPHLTSRFFFENEKEAERDQEWLALAQDPQVVNAVRNNFERLHA